MAAATLERQIAKWNKCIGLFKDIKTTVRPCLKCKKKFETELDTNGIPYNKICKPCRTANKSIRNVNYKIL